MDKIWDLSPYKQMTLKMLNKAPSGRDLRRYVVEEIKAPLMARIVKLGMKYPDPTHENVVHPNSHILIELRDKFLEYENNPKRQKLFAAIWQIFIAEYEHDSYYRERINWVLEELVKTEWKPRPLDQPDQYWNEPCPHGGKGKLIDG